MPVHHCRRFKTLEQYMSDGGKGYDRRPAQVSEEVLDANWRRIFSNSKGLTSAKYRTHENILLKDDEMGFHIKNHIGNDE